MNAKTAQQTTITTTAQPAKKTDKTVPLAAGGALALLAIGGAALAMRRRRHEDEEVWVEEDSIDHDHETMAHEPVEIAEEPAPVAYEQQPGFLAPPVSAFNWGQTASATQPAGDEPLVEQDDREPGETWIERAYRGPSPLNPSVSLKTRLRRAAFFDKRERDAAAGLAAPVDPTAGLPDRMVAQREDELA
jgi:hypothetical protein